MQYDDRRRLLEDRYILDFERLLEVRSRRNWLLAQWVCSLIGRNDRDAYVAEVMEAGSSAAGDEIVLKKVLKDLTEAGEDVGESAVQTKMHELMFAAAEDMARESGKAGKSRSPA
ncbi:ATPase inhibitor subunit zeta [Rhizobium sp. IBUN]|uniref:ATPase inhibitor subunit zeta n=1 Tax=Rhizobium sp. IBUN TaxID=1042326 RepID=UPI000471AA1F|nr:ATPase inhibitor subunit zeta [Rhizobium sp. IBUN]